MLEKLKAIYKDEKKRLNYKTFMNIYEGICLMVISILALIWDRQISNISVLYLLPISFVLFSFEYLYVGCKYKNIEKINIISMLVGSLVLIIIPIYIALNPIESKQNFISVLGIIIILKNIIDFISTSNKQKIEIIKNILFILLGLLIIIFSASIINSYILFLILFIVIGIIKELYAYLLKKIV